MQLAEAKKTKSEIRPRQWGVLLIAAHLVLVAAIVTFALLSMFRAPPVRRGEVGTAVINRQGDVVEWSKDAERLTGYASAEMFGKPFVTVFADSDKLKRRIADEADWPHPRQPELDCKLIDKRGEARLVTVALSEAEPRVRWHVVVRSR